MKKPRKKLNKLKLWANKIILPGFGGVPLYKVVVFFIGQLKSEAISIRAAAVAYSFFLALFPGLIFLFTLIPYIPVANMQIELFQVIRDFLPKGAFDTIETTLKDILLTRHGGLLSFGVAMTVYFATNGIDKLIQSFNHNVRVRFFRRYPISLMLTILLSVLVILSLTILLGGTYLLQHLKMISFFRAIWIYYLVSFFKLVVSVVLLVSAISMLYYFGTVKVHKFSFFSPGAILSAVSIAITSIGFRYYVENFSNYNKLYGSLGALICLMIYLNLNSIMLISGYEFNKSIITARQSYGKPIN